jgi:hypothetical protein
MGGDRPGPRGKLVCFLFLPTSFISARSAFRGRDGLLSVSEGFSLLLGQTVSQGRLTKLAPCYRTRSTARNAPASLCVALDRRSAVQCRDSCVQRFRFASWLVVGNSEPKIIQSGTVIAHQLQTVFFSSFCLME